MKQDFVERVNREMAADFPTADLPAREALAGACRILAREGHESGLAGQVTARAEKAGSWWTLQFGYGFEEATPERMVLIDEDLQPLSGGRPNPGVRFHVWIYRQRPDVKAIIHTHAPYASALAATGEPLRTMHMDSAMLHGGSRMIKLYQCGLTEARLYTGEIDGTWRPELMQALEQCVRDKGCDPLPEDEQCRAATS